MGDRVQYELEGTIDELEDLLDRNLFSRDEIRMIVKKRRDFEYLLQRKTALKEDFMRYIEYELALEKLKQKRKKRKGVKAFGVADKKDRVHILYTRALRKFRGDLELWQTAISYCRKTKANQVAEKRLGEAVRLHPRHVPFWIQAAQFHFEVNKDTSTARNLLQTALRVNKTSAHLWGELLRLEALYILQIRKRRIVLGIDDENGEPIAGKDGGVDGEDQEAAKKDVIYDGKVLNIVYKNALQTLKKGSVELSSRLCASLEPFFDTVIRQPTFALAQRIWIDATQGENIPEAGAEQCWEGRIRFELAHATADLSPIDREKRCLELLQEGLHGNPTQTMANIVVEFVLGRIKVAKEEEKEGGEEASNEDAPRSRKRQRRTRTASSAEDSRVTLLREMLEDVINRCEQGSLSLSETMLMRIARETNDMQLTERCFQLAKLSPKFCSMKIELMRQSKVGMPLVKAARKLLDDGLATFVEQGFATDPVRREEVKDLFLEYLDLVIACDALEFDQVLAAFLDALKWLYTECRDDGERIIDGLLRWIASAHDLELFRIVFDKIRTSCAPPVIPLQNYETAIELVKEMTVDVSGKSSSSSLAPIRALYEDMVRFHTSEPSCWRSFVRFEREHGDMATEKTILVRAMQSVSQSREDFLQSL